MRHTWGQSSFLYLSLVSASPGCQSIPSCPVEYQLNLLCSCAFLLVKWFPLRSFLVFWLAFLFSFLVCLAVPLPVAFCFLLASACSRVVSPTPATTDFWFLSVFWFLEFFVRTFSPALEINLFWTLICVWLCYCVPTETETWQIVHYGTIITGDV